MMESITKEEREILLEIADALHKFLIGEIDADDFECKASPIVFDSKDDGIECISGFPIDNILNIYQGGSPDENIYLACLYYIWISKILRGKASL